MCIWIVGGKGSSYRNASRDESVETGDESVEAGDESIEAGEKTQQSCYNTGQHALLWIVDDRLNYFAFARKFCLICTNPSI